MNAALEAFRAERKPPLKLTRAEPVAILADAKRAALKADWLLSRWEEFSRTSRACLTPDCQPEEMAKFMDVVRERFDVTTTHGERRWRLKQRRTRRWRS